MTNTEKDVFISFLKEEIFEQGYDDYYKDKYGNAWEVVKKFWKELCKFQVPEENNLTPTGANILSFMRVYCEQICNNKYEFTTKEVSEGLLLKKVSVSRAMDKLSRDGYIYKKEQQSLMPKCKYILTTKGLNCVIKDNLKNKE